MIIIKSAHLKFTAFSSATLMSKMVKQLELADPCNFACAKPTTQRKRTSGPGAVKEAAQRLTALRIEQIEEKTPNRPNPASPSARPHCGPP